MDNLRETQPSEITRSDSYEMHMNDVRAELAGHMVGRLTSPNAFTVEYYVPGKLVPMFEREGAAWERFAFLKTTDGRRIGIHMLKNNPKFREEYPSYGKPNGEGDRLRMVVLENETNRLTEVMFSPEFGGLTETTPRNSELGTDLSTHPQSRTTRWDRGLPTQQQVLDNPTGNPRALGNDELQELCAILSDVDNCVTDPAVTANSLRRCEGGRLQGTQVADAAQDPFLRLVHGGEQQTNLPLQQS